MYRTWIRWTSQLILIAMGATFLFPVISAATPVIGTTIPETKGITFNPPNRGAPGQSQDAGSRNPCLTTDIPFTAIAPVTNWGETLSAHPTFWLYLPQPAEMIELTLYDEEDQEEALYQTTFSPSGTIEAGIGQFTLPESAPELEPGRLYRWRFAFVCDMESDPAAEVTGIVVRRSPTSELAEQLQIASPQEQVALLAEHGLWYDTVDQLAQLRQRSPDDETLAADWESLLTHPIARLDTFVPTMFLDCCSE
ncbi:DUF928 domain-containing protein [Vacuolonema iberomarrocanum]|uniref:DUF928 domain-containing protein n=1 Tax=Vacuolonema iberomarrocanum TaxID=3454632 RepID=UPI001A106951|nr:DUF928 domain-containing protein [filamentous cyanobacterium LEGE 07170]